MTRPYDYQAIESKWQRYWREHDTFRTLGPGDEGFDASKPKFYVLDMFPYPSGAGLHVGHPLGYIATDIVARYKRMTGHNVLHPMGFDAFGLPAEQYAVEHGVHPRITTEKNIDNMRRQLKGFGLSYDWRRELATIDPRYYRWTQWIFLSLYHSWFDPEANAARPIAELEHKLAERSAEERRAIVEDARLAYLADVPVNWCPALGTVLANEEVTADGRSERGNHPVFKRPLKQWMLRITAYAERLLADLELVDWPEKVKLMQRNWIGRSEGAMVDFGVDGVEGETIRVYTTRPDTLFGATFMVLAPEHPLVARVTSDAQAEAVGAYQREAAARSDVDRQAEVKTKSGVPTGSFAINPVNGAKIPIWIADYVLMGYGTGAIMAVPSGDQRDFEFAKQFGLPIIPVVDPTDDWLREQAADVGLEGDDAAIRAAYYEAPERFNNGFVGDGKGINSKNDEVSLDGLATPEAKRVITEWLNNKGLGQFQVQYKLRDWLFSRQRYWGEPFPMLHATDGSLRAVDPTELPVTLPPMEDFKPTAGDPNDPAADPAPSLSRAPAEWREVERDGERYVRELNTMPQWAGSCWYYLRFIDPDNDEALVDREKERYWMGEHGVDLYVGGVEHAVLHLLYARFWHKVLFDLGHVSTPEPFGKLFNQGYILAAAFRDERNVCVPAEEVEERDGKYFYQGKEVAREYGKMGKSLKNAVNPDELFESFGCDTLRLYEMYMGPIETSKPWNTRDIVGVNRFLQRVWRNFYGELSSDEAEAPATPTLRVSDEAADEALERLLHQTVKRVTDDMERMRFNTALAAMIELNNELVKRETMPRAVAETLVRMLGPFAPHVAEELWQALGHEASLAYEAWPSYDESKLASDTMEIVVQIKGKTRGKVTVAADASEDAIKDAALSDEKISKHVEGKTIRKVIYVKGRLINIVAT
ncbi:MAG: leucine--tRNA ligase [Myxococcales bacterium]|nr:leucine--tRNA ligase [Myxococcales bacterium]